MGAAEQSTHSSASVASSMYEHRAAEGAMLAVQLFGVVAFFFSRICCRRGLREDRPSHHARWKVALVADGVWVVWFGTPYSGATRLNVQDVDAAGCNVTRGSTQGLRTPNEYHHQRKPSAILPSETPILRKMEYLSACHCF